MALQHSNSVVSLAFLLVTLGMLAKAQVFRFDKNVYTVGESPMASVKVCVVANTGTSTGSDSTMNVSISTMDGTAKAISDYIPTIGHQLEFTQGIATYQNKCIDIKITNDGIYEPDEYFYILVGGENQTSSNATIYIVDDDKKNCLECAEDTYIITEDTTKLTACVVSDLACALTNCTVVIPEGVTIDHSIEVLDEDDGGHTIMDCVKLEFSHPTGDFNINFIKKIAGSSSENTKATCRVKVISSSKVPELFLELDVYFIQEGKPLELCGFLVDDTGEFEPSESLTATFKSDTGEISLTLNFIENSSYFDEDSRLTHPYCGSAIIISDNLQPERVRYFSIELSGPELNVPGIQPLSAGSSDLFVTDDDGPNVECNDVIGILSAGRSCFQELSLAGDDLNTVINCYIGGETDCTNWKYPDYNFMAKNPGTLERYLPSLCPHSLQSELFQPLYSMQPTRECSTQCIVFTPSNPQSCPRSTLLMNQVFALAALELNGTEIVLEDCQLGQNTTLRIMCCGLENSTCTAPAFSQNDIIGSAVGGAVVLVCVLVFVFVLPALLCCRRYRGKHSIEKSAAAVDHETARTAMENPNYTAKFEPWPGYWKIQHRQSVNVDRYAMWRQVFASVIINPSQLKTQEMLGEGAFGQVHKGSLITSQGDVSTQVAIKSLRDSSNVEVDNFITESAIMLDFSHPNVIKLVGVCFDTEDGLPLIVLPYMANGDLKTFLKTERLRNDGGTSTGSMDHFPPGLTDAILIGTCLDIAKGMEYLSRSKFVHRDLAARNCMVDENLQVCVADFGLSKDVYSSEYYRLTHAARLPVKWMAPESLHDNVYNEKTDIWSFGVVCWEVFSLGQMPFPGVDNADIPDYISRGHRLRQPSLCPDEMNDLMQSTWKKSPEERPTFLQLVYSLANVLGQDIDQEYFAMEGPEHEAGEVDYDAASSSTSKPGGTTPKHSLIPEGYEVPFPSRSPTPSTHTAPLPLASSTHDAPEYAIDLSQGSTESPELLDREATASSHVPNQTDPRTYHALEQLHIS